MAAYHYHQLQTKPNGNNRLGCAIIAGLVVFMIVNISTKEGGISSNYVHSSGRFSNPDELKLRDHRFINIVVKLKGLAREDHIGYKLQLNFDILVRSLVLRTNAKPLNLIFLCDEASIPLIEKTFADEQPPFELTNKLDEEEAVPRFSLTYVDMDLIRIKVKEWSSQMKEFFNNHNKGYVFLNYDGRNRNLSITYPDKYDDDMFYIAPFYHRIFPQVSRLITVDVDVEFHVDPAQLYRQFDHFSPEAVAGAANDLAPHYHQMLTGYRELHPDTELGMPGPFQGLNVGVLLLELDRMRESKEYNAYLTKEETTRLAVKYHMVQTHLGEQDWLTLLQFERPDLVYVMPCRYNRQLGRDYQTGPWVEMFPLFHECGEDKGLAPFIVHGNSDSNI